VSAPELRRLVAAAQSERIPSVAAAVVRDGEVVFSDAIGIAEPGRDATPDDQYRVGSISKTFCAVAVMQLRDEGALSLDEPLTTYVPESAEGPSIRRLLAHSAGLEREPKGEIWETLKPPTRDEFLAQLADVENVLEPGRRFHYSNLGFALLGELVRRVAGKPFEDHVDERILRPLGLERTTWRATAPFAKGYFVGPYDELLRPEGDMEPGATQSVGGLWSTVGDLARWAAFLADPDPAVLRPETVDEMASVQVMVDRGWTVGYGLGLQLFRAGERVFAGHGGAMPGFRAGLAVLRAERAGAAVLTNTSAGAEPEELSIRLVLKSVELDPPAPRPWRPQEEVPAAVRPLLGRWWSEGHEFVFFCRDGRLHARLEPPVASVETSVFEPAGDDRFRTVSGRENGEWLRVSRDESGAVTKLYWATYAFTRDPQVFGPG
jgi:CubicO group peptidase (beta-lactamase class C family)